MHQDIAVNILRKNLDKKGVGLSMPPSDSPLYAALVATMKECYSYNRIDKCLCTGKPNKNENTN